MQHMKIFTKENYSPDELELIEIEHRLSYLRLFKSTLFVQALFPIFLSYVFYSLIPKTILISWLFAILLVTSLRGYLTFFWYKIDSDAKKTDLFEKLSLFLSLLAGCLWGATVLIMDFNQYPEQSVFLNIVVFGLTAGSVGIGSYWIGYFIIYNASVFSIYISTYIIGSPEPYYLLATSLFLFSIFMMQIALVFHRGNAENIWLIKRNEKLAENLAEKKEQAEDFASSRTRFLASASHDLRQPIQALNFFLAALEPHLNTQPSKDIFQKLEKCTDGVNELLNAILDISKLDSSTLQLNKSACDLDNILKNLTRQFKNQSDDKNLELTCQTTSLHVYSDSVLLQRILSNLISNAINYTENGHVEIRLSESTDSILIEIIDTGLGISVSEQKRIFEEFYQLGNPERDKKKGLGLGLSIVKKLCLLMDIPLSLDSQRGQGSSFGIKLPLCAKPINTSETIKTLSYQNLMSKKILVIDDEDIIREGLSELLSRWQCDVIATDSEENACKAIQAKGVKPDLIIADYRLRDNKNGVDAINKVKALFDGIDIPTIIISGDTEPARLKQVALSGYELLHKPVKPAQLRMLMQRKLN